MMAGPNISSVTGKTIRTVRFGFRTPRILIWFCNFSSQQSRTLFEGPKCLGFVPCIQIKLKAHSLIRGGGGLPCNIKMRFPNWGALVLFREQYGMKTLRRNSHQWFIAILLLVFSIKIIINNNIVDDPWVGTYPRYPGYPGTNFFHRPSIFLFPHSSNTPSPFSWCPKHNPPILMALLEAISFLRIVS